MKKICLFVMGLIFTTTVYAEHPLQKYKPTRSLCGAPMNTGAVNTCLKINQPRLILQAKRIVQGKNLAWVFENKTGSAIQVKKDWIATGYRGCIGYGAIMPIDLSRKIADAKYGSAFQIPPNAALVFSEKHFINPEWGGCMIWDVGLPTNFGEINIENM